MTSWRFEGAVGASRGMTWAMVSMSSKIERWRWRCFQLTSQNAERKLIKGTTTRRIAVELDHKQYFHHSEGKTVVLDKVVPLAIRLSFFGYSQWNPWCLGFRRPPACDLGILAILRHHRQFRRLASVCPTLLRSRHAVNCTKSERSRAHPPNCLRNLISRPAMWAAAIAVHDSRPYHPP